MKHMGVDWEWMRWNMLTLTEFLLNFTIGRPNSTSLQLSAEISSSFMSAQMYMFFHLEHTQIQLCSN